MAGFGCPPRIINDRIVKPLQSALPRGDLRALASSRIWGRSTRLQDKLREYLPVAGVTLPPKLLHDCDQLTKLRNTIVHATQVAPIPVAEATKAVRTVTQVVRVSLDALRQKSVT